MGVLLKALRPAQGPGIFWPQDWPANDTVARSLSGASVTAETAFGLPAFYAAVRAISEDIAKLPFIVYEDLEPRGKRRAKEHPLYRVLHDVANPEMTAFIWREASVAHMITWGNCYSEIQRNGLGEIVALWPIPPHRVTVKRNDDGERYYRVRLPKPDPETRSYDKDLKAAQVFHVPGLGYDGLVGYNPIELLGKSLGLSLAAQEYAERTWENNAQPGGVLNVPRDLEWNDTLSEKLRTQFSASHAGLSNAQRFALLQDGITLTPYTVTPEAAQMIETRKFQVTETARGLRIQPHKIGDLERATFSNIEHQDLEYTRDSLGGWASRIEAQAKKDLFGQEEPFFAEFLFDAHLRADSLTRARVWSTYRMMGNVTPNYINERENFPLRDDPGGDEYLRPLNMAIEGGESSADGSANDVVKMTIQSVPENGHQPLEVTA